MLRSIPPRTMTDVMRPQKTDGRVLNIGIGGIQTSPPIKRGQQESSSWDGSVERHVYKKEQRTKQHSSATASLPHELFLENKVRLHQIKVIQDLMQEMRQAIADGFPVVDRELERLEKRLTELEAE